MSSLFDLRLVFICFFLYFFLLCLPPVGYQYQCNTWGAVMSQNLTVSGSHVVGQVYQTLIDIDKYKSMDIESIIVLIRFRELSGRAMWLPHKMASTTWP